MFIDMVSNQTAESILELRAEAAGARRLAATFEKGPTFTDLLNYADALDREAAQLEFASSEITVQAPSNCTIPLEIVGC